MKKFICSLLIIIIAVTVSLVVVKATNGLNDPISNAFLNQDNLIRQIDEYTSKEGKADNGITWEVTSSGAVKASGKLSESSASAEFVLGSVTVETEDYYTLSGCSTGALDTYYIVAEYEDDSGNTKRLYADFAESMISDDKIAEGTVITVKIVILPGAEFSSLTFKPTLVPGKEAGKF